MKMKISEIQSLTALVVAAFDLTCVCVCVCAVMYPCVCWGGVDYEKPGETSDSFASTSHFCLPGSRNRNCVH